MENETVHSLKRSHIRKRLELAEIRQTIPPCDTVSEAAALRIVMAAEHSALVLESLEPEDFYREEYRELFTRMLALKRMKDGPERTKLWNGIKANAESMGLGKSPGTADEAIATCAALRELRRQRRIDLAAREIYLSHEDPSWVANAEREIDAVKRIKSVSVNGKPKPRVRA